jgi:hypothetical protein
MSQQALYQKVKAERMAEEEAARRKELGLFTKQEVHNLVASALVDILNTLTNLPDPIIVGYGEDSYPLMHQVEKFQSSRNLYPIQIDPSTWAAEIKKD